mgnify:CR=1 FL=1
MQVTELENDNLKRTLKITVDAARINEQLEAELKAAGERIKIPGFRPGFIPMKVLKQRYGKSVQADVIKNVIGQTSNEALKEKKLRPVMGPQINIEDYKDEGDLIYTLSFELFPDVPDVAFDGITLNRPVFEVAESDIDTAAERIAKRNPSLDRATQGGKAAKGQVVSIDFKGMVDGKAFDGGSASDFRLELGSGQFIEGFEDQLVGAKEGDDIIVKVTFPGDYPSKNLAGKEASFAVKVKEIYDMKTPAVDEEFAKQHGFKELTALRDAIRDQLVKEYDMAVRRRLKKQLFDVLEEECTFPLPAGMVEMEFEAIWARIKEARDKGDVSLADRGEEELKKEYQGIAARRVKLGLLLAEVGNRTKIQVTNEEINRALMQQASQFPGQEQKVIEFYKSHPEKLDDLRGPVLEEKAVDYILTKVKYDDEKTTLAELAEEDGEEDKASEQSAKKTSSKKKSTKKSSDA